MRCLKSRKRCNGENALGHTNVRSLKDPVSICKDKPEIQRTSTQGCTPQHVENPRRQTARLDNGHFSRRDVWTGSAHVNSGGAPLAGRGSGPSLRHCCRVTGERLAWGWAARGSVSVGTGCCGSSARSLVVSYKASHTVNVQLRNHSPGYLAPRSTD